MMNGWPKKWKKQQELQRNKLLLERQQVRQELEYMQQTSREQSQEYVQKKEKSMQNS